MPEIDDNRSVFSLLEVTKSIQKTISERYTSSFWVKAEMNKLNYYKQSGHCYPELVEKKEGRIVAQVRANLWSQQFQAINEKFLAVLKEPLKDGIKILFSARINFDPVHGLGLQIIDIDPRYTLGDLEKEKAETIEALKRKGIYNANKNIPLPLLPQRIALISVESSKGYADFLNVINNNQWGYKFFHFLFPSLLQGDKAVDSILGQLKRIRSVAHHFDVVAIIRGGGGDIGLTCYNNQILCEAIAEFPLPVFTGIGHATNETVAEMIAHTNAITPTKLAEYLIQQFHNFSVPVQKAQELIINRTERIISDGKNNLDMQVKLFRSLTDKKVASEKNALLGFTYVLSRYSRFIFQQEDIEIRNLSDRISRSVAAVYTQGSKSLSYLSLLLERNVKAAVEKKNWEVSRQQEIIRNETANLFSQQKMKAVNLNSQFYKAVATDVKEKKISLQTIEKTVRNLSPENVLKRGYSITLVNGKAIHSPGQLKAGEVIKTILHVGTISSVVTETKNGEEL
jgi:exodeoxyribonuclease VII large subunit